MTKIEPQRQTLISLNSFGRDDFVQFVGPVFENSPWIAEAAWPRRPFATIQALHQALCEIVAASGETKQLELIRAHPDLVGKAARAGTLTRESTAEQAAAGLSQLTSSEIRAFEENNQAYRRKFGFPFVICARLNRKEAILEGFRLRLPHSREQEIRTALEEIYKIAYLRLQDILGS
jgi:OHCU decarboxylase